MDFSRGYRAVVPAVYHYVTCLPSKTNQASIRAITSEASSVQWQSYVREYVAFPSPCCDHLQTGHVIDCLTFPGCLASFPNHGNVSLLVELFLSLSFSLSSFLVLLFHLSHSFFLLLPYLLLSTSVVHAISEYEHLDTIWAEDAQEKVVCVFPERSILHLFRFLIL